MAMAMASYLTYAGWVKDVRCCTVIDSLFQGLDNSPDVKYSIILRTVQDLKVGNTNSISVV